MLLWYQKYRIQATKRDCGLALHLLRGEYN